MATLLKDRLAAASAPKEDPKPEAPTPVGIPTFKALKLKRFVDQGGKYVYPNADGIFVPTNSDEFEILIHFAQTGMDHVELIPAAKEE